MLKETADFAKSIEKMMRKTLGVSADEGIEEEDEEEVGGDGVGGTEEADEVEDNLEEHDEL